MNQDSKINQLLHSQQAANNALALQLLMGQDYTELEALMYVLDYHSSHFWELPTQEWELELLNTHFRLYIFEDQDAFLMDNQADLICTITTNLQKISTRKYLGEFDYPIVYVEPDASSPTLFNFKKEAKKIFQVTVKKWLTKIS